MIFLSFLVYPNLPEALKGPRYPGDMSPAADEAAVSAWIRRDSSVEAIEVAVREICEASWTVGALSACKRSLREDYDEDDEGLHCFEQAEVDGEVLLFNATARERFKAGETVSRESGIIREDQWSRWLECIRERGAWILEHEGQPQLLKKAEGDNVMVLWQSREAGAQWLERAGKRPGAAVCAVSSEKCRLLSGYCVAQRWYLGIGLDGGSAFSASPYCLL